ncbi:MAG: hypothetical protein ACKO91_13220 [Acidimicrobiales bacterium]
MFARSPQRRLRRVAERLVRVRAELGEVEAQYRQLADDADDAGRDALVAGDRWSAHLAAEDRRHADALDRRRRDLLGELARLEADQDELLDRLNQLDRPGPGR